MMTQKQIKDNFNNYIEQQNPDVNPRIIGTDWDIYGTAISGIGAGFYQDVESLRQALFVQFSSGLFLDYSAFSLGLPPRQGASFALVVAANSVLPGSPFFFPAGTVFTSTFNGDQYVLINDTTMSISVDTMFSLQSQQSGNGYQLSVGSALTNTLHPTVSISVNSSTDGQLAESDGQLRKRILQAKQNPTGAGRASDYINWSIIGGGVEGSINDNAIGGNNIQGALIIPSFFSNNVIGVFTLSGTFNYDFVLLNDPSNTSPYTLTTPPAILFGAQTYINTQKPVQANTYISSVSTFMIPNAIIINVVLPVGVTLATTVNNFDGSSISVENIIYQEFRRGIISYQLGATIISGAAFLMLSQLEQVVDVGLSINGGIYQELLISREILVDGLTQNISVPYNTLDGNNNLQAVYDILQSDVTINQI